MKTIEQAIEQAKHDVAFYRNNLYVMLDPLTGNYYVNECYKVSVRDANFYAYAVVTRGGTMMLTPKRNDIA